MVDTKNLKIDVNLIYSFVKVLEKMQLHFSGTSMNELFFEKCNSR